MSRRNVESLHCVCVYFADASNIIIACGISSRASTIVIIIAIVAHKIFPLVVVSSSTNSLRERESERRLERPKPEQEMNFMSLRHNQSHKRHFSFLLINFISLLLLRHCKESGRKNPLSLSLRLSSLLSPFETTIRLSDQALSQMCQPYTHRNSLSLSLSFRSIVNYASKIDDMSVTKRERVKKKSNIDNRNMTEAREEGEILFEKLPKICSQLTSNISHIKCSEESEKESERERKGKRENVFLSKNKHTRIFLSLFRALFAQMDSGDSWNIMIHIYIYTFFNYQLYNLATAPISGLRNEGTSIDDTPSLPFGNK